MILRKFAIETQRAGRNSVIDAANDARQIFGRRVDPSLWLHEPANQVAA
jgi:hypothetical protein